MKKIKDMTKKQKKILVYFALFVITLEGVLLGMLIESEYEFELMDSLKDEVFVLVTGEPYYKETPLTDAQICDTFILSMYDPDEARQALKNGLDKFCTPSPFIQSLIDKADSSIIKPQFGDGGLVMAVP